MSSRRSMLGRGLILVTALLLTAVVNGCAGTGPIIQPPVPPPPGKRPTLYEVWRGPPADQQLVAAVYVAVGAPDHGQECASGARMPIVPTDMWVSVGEAPPADWCLEYGPQLPEPFVADWVLDPNDYQNAQFCSAQPVMQPAESPAVPERQKKVQ